MNAIPRFPFQTLRWPFISDYITLALFLLSRKKEFATLLSVIEKTYILIWFFYLLKCGEMMRVITFLVTGQGELVSLLTSH